MNAETRIKLLLGELQFQNAIYSADLEAAKKRIAELEDEVLKLQQRTNGILRLDIHQAI